MSTDNRTVINDCEATTGWTGDDAVTAVTNTGEFYEGSGALSWQASNADEQMHTTQDSVGAGTFSLDWSDSTLYLLVKDNLQNTAANGGVQFVVGDGTDLIGYDVGGNDAVGLPALGAYYNCYKLDMSNRPAAFTVHSGVEANLTDTAITQVGYGCLHLAKANGPSDNVFMDQFSYIANGSYALTINGGTAGTPETMADVQGDDVTNGWGMVSNPLGDQFLFIAPTEWGNSAATAEHAFTATNEQWYWLGDNGGGHAVGATHFPMRVIGNATDTGSFILSGVVVINTGTGAEFDCSSGDVNTLEIDGCTFVGLATFNAPSSGGTSRFATNTIFSNCGTVTHNGADMSGCSFLESTAAANGDAIFYDEATDPDGEMDNMTFVQGTNAHHAMTFGANIPASITIRDADFTGFSASDDNDGSVFQFEDTSGTITLNLVNCTNDGSGFTVDSRAGCTVNVVIDPVTTLLHVNDNLGADLEDARVYLQASDGTGDLPFEDSVTITRSGTVATVAHTAHGLATGNLVKIRGITDKTIDNSGTHVITVTTANAYTYVTTDAGSTNYTGTITSTGVIFNGDTDVNGDISDSRTFSTVQPVVGRVRKSTGSPFFKSFPISGSISNTTGLTVNVQMVSDE